eukprot:TRINITY_DN2343_c0_g1_i10.p1 TRINITY_DN2343_c0_g1~~TRINITY_DN2343_c0_g1_i10.p1  ORF type:complete len:231 (+),score=76.93 TRINITY_DN2343_c0_g1_i10:516-1208(+)
MRMFTGGASFLLSKMRDPWERFWFAIRDDKLVYYRDKPASEAEGAKFVGVVDLAAVDSILPVDDSSRAHEFVVKGGDTTWRLAADSEGEQQLWICGLYHAINASHWQDYEDGTEAQESVVAYQSRQTREGPLEMQSMLRLWRKRWCILRDGFILVYRKQGDNRQRARIPLYQCEMEEYRPEKEDAAFKIKTDHGEFILRAESSEEMQFWCNAILVEKHTIEALIDNIHLE